MRSGKAQQNITRGGTPSMGKLRVMESSNRGKCDHLQGHVPRFHGRSNSRLFGSSAHAKDHNISFFLYRQGGLTHVAYLLLKGIDVFAERKDEPPSPALPLHVSSTNSQFPPP